MIAIRKEFYGGIGLFAGFIIVLIIMFMPIFSGNNALAYLDALYNSISKGSAYYIPSVRKEIDKFAGTSIQVNLSMTSKNQAKQTAVLFQSCGATVGISSLQIKVAGDLGNILENSLADADIMYHNDGQEILEKYGFSDKQALLNWWTAFQDMDKELKKQKKFEAAKAVDLVAKKAVEPAYNYYGIEPQNISDRFGIVLFSLLFYVIYTLWYGFAVLYLFEGWGLKLGY